MLPLFCACAGLWLQVERRLPALGVEAKSGAADGRPHKSLQVQPDEAAGGEQVNPRNSKVFVTNV
jgi:hypothetical protein